MTIRNTPCPVDERLRVHLRHVPPGNTWGGLLWQCGRDHEAAAGGRRKVECARAMTASADTPTSPAWKNKKDEGKAATWPEQGRRTAQAFCIAAQTQNTDTHRTRDAATATGTATRSPHKGTKSIIRRPNAPTRIPLRRPGADGAPECGRGHFTSLLFVPRNERLQFRQAPWAV